ncbi:MAG TPA: hypothetical protein DHW40_06020 [Microbacterium sp.]|nr:hypothetical protein [Microbacterium sp.]
MTTASNDGLLAPSDIADLAGVSRAAVSNWRKRMSDFPSPVAGTVNKPLFAATDIQAWMRANPDKVKSKSAASAREDAWETRLWGASNLLRGRLAVDGYGEIFVQIAVDVIEGVPSQPRDGLAPDEIRSIRSAIESIPRDQLPDAIDALLERTSRALGKSSGEVGFVGSRVSTLLASLAAETEHGGVLYDPACGVGVALLEAVKAGARPSRIVGDDINDAALRTATGRAKLRGVNFEGTLADVLANDPHPTLYADVIIAEPPFGVRIDAVTSMLDERLRFGIPPRNAADTFWIQHVVARLAPDGVGYVVTPHGPLFRSGAESEIRRNLLAADKVRAIVGLPGRMLPHTAIPLALWVLGDAPSDSRSAGTVLLIDASAVDDAERRASGWLADESTLEGVPHGRFPVEVLVKGGLDLSPARWVAIDEVDGAAVVAEFYQAQQDLLTASDELAAAARRSAVPRLPTGSQVVTIAKLTEAGAVEVSPARPVKETGAVGLEERHVDAGMVRTGVLPYVKKLSGDAAPPGMMTEPGDILLTTIDKVRAVVDETGGLIPVGGVTRLRVDRNALDPHFVADVLTGDWNLRFSAGTAIRRIPVRSIEIPLLPLETQRRLHEAIAVVNRTRDLAAKASEAARTLTKTMLTAARHGIDLSVNNEGLTR